MKRLVLFVVAVIFAFSTMACCCCPHHRDEHKKSASHKVTTPVKKDVQKSAKPAEEPAK